jgi:hypothetical protein
LITLGLLAFCLYWFTPLIVKSATDERYGYIAPATDCQEGYTFTLGKCLPIGTAIKEPIHATP